MSDNSTGAGGSAAPGWYADPYDSSQLRWWSGQVWTEHVSPAKPPVAPEAAVAPGADLAPETAVESEVAQPVVAAEAAPVAEAAPAVAAEPETVAPATYTVTPSAPDALPSRRALREANLEAETTAQPVSAGEPVSAAQSVGAAEPVAAEPAPAEPAPAEPVAAEPVAAPVTPVQEPHHPTQALRPEDFELAADQNRWNQPLSTGSGPAWGEPAAQTPTTASPEAVAPDAAVPTAAATEAQAASTPPVSIQPASVQPTSVQPVAVQPEAIVPTLVQPAAGAQPDTGATTTDDWGLRPTGAAPDATPRPTTANTPWVWLIAISPLIAAAIIIYGLATGEPSFTNVLFIVGFVAPYLLVVVFALADRSRLVILGHTQAASWTWAALTAPVYLVVRGGVIRRELGSAGPALYVWLACFVIGIAAFALYGLLTGHALVPGLPEGKLF